MAFRLSVMENGTAHSWGPFVTCLPYVFPQAGQTPLETARHHNNPEVALLLTKAPQVGLTASFLLTVWGYTVAIIPLAVVC